MRTWTAALLIAIGMPATGSAQMPTPAAERAPAAPPTDAPTSDAPRAYAGTVSGSVRQLNLARGTITVQAGQGTVTFNADPGQLAPLDAGDRVAFPYLSYEGALWLPPEATRGEIGQLPADPRATVTGTIRRLQRAQGTITVRGLTFRIHPSRLEGLVPGQLVRLTFGQVGQTSWVAELQPIARRARPPADAPPPEEPPADVAPAEPAPAAPSAAGMPPDAQPEATGTTAPSGR
jgi:hypothetical protein